MAMEIQSSKVVLPSLIFPLKILVLEDTRSWKSEFFIAPGLETAQYQSLFQNKTSTVGLVF